MKKMLSILIVMCFAFCCVACARGRDVDNSPVRSLDLSRFLGRWYEIARFDHSFERGMDYTQAFYSLKSDGTIKVVNSGLKKGKHRKSEGKAFRPSADQEPGLLRVSFFGPFYSDYRILMIDADYHYVLIGSKSDKYLWILAREPHIPEASLNMILDEAHRRGYDTSRLYWVGQENMDHNIDYR